MLGSQQSNDVFVADEEHDCSLLGQDHSRKIRAKPVRVSLVFFAARNQMRPKLMEIKSPWKSVSGEKRIQLPWLHPCSSSKPKGQGWWIEVGYEFQTPENVFWHTFTSLMPGEVLDRACKLLGNSPVGFAATTSASLWFAIMTYLIALNIVLKLLNRKQVRTAWKNNLLRTVFVAHKRVGLRLHVRKEHRWTDTNQAVTNTLFLVIAEYPLQHVKLFMGMDFQSSNIFLQFDNIST